MVSHSMRFAVKVCIRQFITNWTRMGFLLMKYADTKFIQLCITT